MGLQTDGNNNGNNVRTREESHQRQRTHNPSYQYQCNFFSFFLHLRLTPWRYEEMNSQKYLYLTDGQQQQRHTDMGSSYPSQSVSAHHQQRRLTHQQQQQLQQQMHSGKEILLRIVKCKKIALCGLRWFKLNVSKCQKMSSCQKDVKCQKFKHLDYGGGSQKK